MSNDRINGTRPSPRSRDATAARWIARKSLGELKPADEARLAEWLAAHPENRSSFERLGGALARTDDLAAFVRGTDAHLRGEARRRRRQIGAGAASLALLLFVTSVFDPGVWFADLHTARGELRSLTLSDGTRLWLDADSAVDIDMRPDERRVALLRGRIHAEVAHNPLPFVVVAAGGEVRDIGTAFDVELGPDEARTLVTEGVVEVRSNGTALRLEAGESGGWSEGGRPIMRPGDGAEHASDWREGRLGFDDRPLRDVLRTLGRYSRKRLVLLNDEIGARRVSGVVRISRADQDIVSLVRSQGLDVTDLGPVVLLR